MSDDNYSNRAARGQAYNLAILTAIADGRQHDNKYVVKQFYRHLKFANLLQSVKDEVLVQYVENPQLIAALEQLDKAVEGKESEF